MVSCSRRSRLGWLVLLAAWIGASAGCPAESRQGTELLLIADTDVPGPSQIQFKIMGPEGPSRVETVDAPYNNAADLPATLALVHTQGPLGPFTVSASVGAPGGQTITRTHVVAFVHGKTLLVPLHLAEACLDQTCLGRQCNENATCVEEKLPALMPYDGEPGRVFEMDGGSLEDAGETRPDAALADAGTASDAGSEADASTDAGGPPLTMCGPMEVDLQTNKNHCGKCNNDCTGMRVCIKGKCRAN